MKKENLIRHCERMIDRYETTPAGLHIYLEHKIFLELLTGRDVNDMFDEKGEYINDEN